MEKTTIINLLKVVSNIILGILLLLALITIYYYHQEVKEALKLEEPQQLIQLYEKKTGKNCYCDYEQNLFIVPKS